MIDGAVTDTNLVSLADATASILGSNLRVVTGANGRFRIVGLAAGPYILVIQHAGFTPSTTTVQVVAGDTLRMSFTLEPAALVPDAGAAAAARAARMAEFEERRRISPALVKTEAEIERANVSTTMDLIRSFPSVSVRGRIAVNARDNIVEDPCPLRLFVDGVALETTNLDQLPRPKDLAGIEVYSRGIPLKYWATRDASCGSILVWTKG